MNQIEIVEVLKEKFLDNQSKYRIGLNGKWGIGKSYAWELLKENISKKKDDKELNVIYCSLFGIDTVEVLKKEIKRKKLEQNEYIGKISKNADNILVKATGMLGRIASNTYLGGTVDLFELVTLDFEDNYLICFDDLERTLIPLTEVMGVIEQVAQTTSVLVIYNDQEINDENNIFKIQKEKILEIEYTLDAISSEIIGKIIDKASNDFTETEKEALTAFFSKHGNNNLRTLNKLTRFISELKGKIPFNAELVNICSAVFLESMSKKDIPKIATDEEKSQRELNPLLVYAKYNIYYRAFSLVDQIEEYIVTNKINKNLFEEYINPREKSQIVTLIDRFYQAIVGDEQSLKNTIEESIVFLNKSNRNELNLEYLVSLVGDMKFYDKLFDFNLIPQQFNDIIMEKMKKLIEGYYEIKEIKSKNQLSVFTRVTVRTEVKPLVQDLLLDAKSYEKQIIQQAIDKNFRNNFDNKNYDECEIILKNNIDLLSNFLYIFEDLSQPCSEDYFLFIRNILNDLRIENNLKMLVRRKLFNLKREQKDVVANYRIRVVLIEFLKNAYNKNIKN
jgi:hypothetical protein